MSIEVFILIIFGAIICEFIDSSMGMLYGTILSPVLILVGFEPILVVPAILFSQAMGGFTATIFHHRLKNADFSLKSKNPKLIIKKILKVGWVETFRRGTTIDFKTFFCITGLGIIATIFAAIIAINIPKAILKAYIGILVLVMGILIVSGIKFKFSWKKILAIGALSALNKGLSGGGFGPVVTAGQIISERDGKSSVGTTTFAEVPICITGFLTYVLIKGISDWKLIFSLSIGAVIGATFGPFFTARFKSDKKLKMILGILVAVLGAAVLILGKISI